MVVPPLQESRRRLPQIMETNDVIALMEVPNTRCPTGLRNRAILESMYRAGLRSGEIVALEPEDVDFERLALRVRTSKGTQSRTVPLDDELARWLRGWREIRSRGAVCFFCTLKGGRLAPRYLQAMMKRLAHKAGLGHWAGVTPHSLRHTYAVNLIDRGCTLQEVQALLGHFSIHATQIYTVLRPGPTSDQISRKLSRHRQGLVRSKADRKEDVAALAARIMALPPEDQNQLAELLELE